MIPPTLGQQIRAVRLSAGVSQKALAEKLGCEQQYISKVECGDITPRTGRLQEFATALDATCTIGKTIAFVPNPKS